LVMEMEMEMETVMVMVMARVRTHRLQHCCKEASLVMMALALKLAPWCPRHIAATRRSCASGTRSAVWMVLTTQVATPAVQARIVAFATVKGAWLVHQLTT